MSTEFSSNARAILLLTAPLIAMRDAASAKARRNPGRYDS